MKKTLCLFAAFLSFSASSLFALGGDAFPAIVGSSKDAWKFDFTFYGRVLTSTGAGIDKDQRNGSKPGFGGSVRIRPGFYATNGNFLFGSQLGADVYLGGIGNATGGSNHYGFGVAGNLVAIQIRYLYLGYLWDSGVYTAWGFQDMSIPYFNGDPAAGITVGWKNKNYDVSLFYFQLTQGNVYKIHDNGELFGVKAEISPSDEFHITPFVMGLAQGSDFGRYSSDVEHHWIMPGPDSINYSDGAKFVGNVGVYAGLGLNYTAPFGLFVNLNAIYLYGKNNPVLPDAIFGTRYHQTRNAAAGMIAVGYALEEMLKAEIFFDIRSGSKKDANSNGTNHSFNGGVIEYDATTPPLLILYNAGDGREGYQYPDSFGDGYAFTDRGATTIGGDVNFVLGDFDLKLALGYAWYSAKRTGTNAGIGFEADIFAAYNMMPGASLYLQTGVLAPSKGLKQETMFEKGGLLRSSTPWLLNFGIKYSL